MALGSKSRSPNGNWIPLVVIAAWGGFGVCYPQDTSAPDLIRLLTRQGSRPEEVASLSGFFTCGTGFAEAKRDRSLAIRLTKLGKAATPAIDGALDSIEARGTNSPFLPNAEWLMYAYAKIEGPAAFSRLQSMKANPALESREYTLDGAIALSLGLTSYADSRRGPPAVFCRDQEPRDALDSLILSWERNDRPSLESSLGPKGKAALYATVSPRVWADLRKDFLPRPGMKSIAVGYRFDITGHWAASEEPLDQEMELEANMAARPTLPSIRTFFKSRSGADCGAFVVNFSLVQDGQSPLPKYVVDNQDLGDLLSLLARCASAE